MSNEEMARLAYDEARKAAGDVQGLSEKLNRIGWDFGKFKETLEEQRDRLEAIEKEQSMQRTAVDSLTTSAERLRAAVDRLEMPLPKTTKEHLKDVRNTWLEAKLKTKTAIALAVVAIFSAPEVLKEVLGALGRLLAQLWK